MIVPFLEALNQNEEKRFIVNLANEGLIPHLDEEVVVEVSAVVSSAGIKPLKPKETPKALKGLLQAEANYRNLAVEAVIERKEKSVVRALAANPLISSVETARKIWKHDLK